MRRADDSVPYKGIWVLVVRLTEGGILFVTIWMPINGGCYNSMIKVEGCL